MSISLNSTELSSEDFEEAYNSMGDQTIHTVATTSGTPTLSNGSTISYSHYSPIEASPGGIYVDYLDYLGSIGDVNDLTAQAMQDILGQLGLIGQLDLTGNSQPHPEESNISVQTNSSDDMNDNATNYDELVQSLAQRYGIQNLKDIDNSPAIPKNKKSYLVKDMTSRFSGAEWFKLIQTKHITLAGLGGIGSHTAFMLSRVHPASMTFYDDDIVEPANMSGQLFGKHDFNKNKGVAMAEMIMEYSDYASVLVTGQKFTENSTPTDIMICGFDNMVARKTYYTSWKNYVLRLPAERRKGCLFIDGRLLMEEFQVLCITGDDEYSMNRYEERFLFSDEEAEEPMCSMKQTSFCASMIGTVITNLFVNFVANQLNPVIPRDLPFYTSYNSTIMFFKTEA